MGHNKVSSYLHSRDSMAVERTKARKITLSKKNHNLDRSFKPCVKTAPFYYNTDNRSAILNLPNFIASRLFRGQCPKNFISLPKNSNRKTRIFIAEGHCHSYLFVLYRRCLSSLIFEAECKCTFGRSIRMIQIWKFFAIFQRHTK